MKKKKNDFGPLPDGFVMLARPKSRRGMRCDELSLRKDLEIALNPYITSQVKTWDAERVSSAFNEKSREMILRPDDEGLSRIELEKKDKGKKHYIIHSHMLFHEVKDGEWKEAKTLPMKLRGNEIRFTVPHGVHPVLEDEDRRTKSKRNHAKALGRRTSTNTRTTHDEIQ